MFNDHRVRILKDFCDSTSLHGYNYLSNGTSIVQKVFWVIIITTMTVIGLSLLVQNTGDFCNSRIVTTIESSSAPLDVSTLESRIDVGQEMNIWSGKLGKNNKLKALNNHRI